MMDTHEIPMHVFYRNVVATTGRNVLHICYFEFIMNEVGEYSIIIIIY